MPNLKSSSSFPLHDLLDLSVIKLLNDFYVPGICTVES